MMKPSALDTFRVRDTFQGQVKVLLLKRAPGKVFQKGLQEFPDLEVDCVAVQESWNAKAVNAGVLLASLFLQVPGKAITHLAVGAGPGAYDIGSPPTVVSNTRLVAEVSRVSMLFTNNVDGSGNPTLEKTNTVDLNFQFGFADAVATLREMGLFGGLGAETDNGGLITNYKVFTPFVKPSDRIMFVTWRLRFNI